MTAPALPDLTNRDYYLGLSRERGAQYALDVAIDDVAKLRTAIARALGGDGEPVAWAVFKGDSYEWVHDDEAKARENERDGYRVVPLYTRPAATGDTGEVEKARAAFYEAAVKWAAASKRDLACRDPYSSQERVNARMGTVDAHLGALAAYDALLAATGDHPSEARRGHESEGRGGPDAR